MAVFFLWRRNLVSGNTLKPWYLCKGNYIWSVHPSPHECAMIEINMSETCFMTLTNINSNTLNQLESLLQGSKGNIMKNENNLSQHHPVFYYFPKRLFQYRGQTSVITAQYQQNLSEQLLWWNQLMWVENVKQPIYKGNGRLLPLLGTHSVWGEERGLPLSSYKGFLTDLLPHCKNRFSIGAAREDGSLSPLGWEELHWLLQSGSWMKPRPYTGSDQQRKIWREIWIFGGDMADDMAGNLKY